jgi:hypothetical protein
MRYASISISESLISISGTSININERSIRISETQITIAGASISNGSQASCKTGKQYENIASQSISCGIKTYLTRVPGGGGGFVLLLIIIFYGLFIFLRTPSENFYASEKEYISSYRSMSSRILNKFEKSKNTGRKTRFRPDVLFNFTSRLAAQFFGNSGSQFRRFLGLELSLRQANATGSPAPRSLHKILVTIECQF